MKWLHSLGLSTFLALYAGCKFDLDALRGSEADALVQYMPGKDGGMLGKDRNKMQDSGIMRDSGIGDSFSDALSRLDASPFDAGVSARRDSTAGGEDSAGGEERCYRNDFNAADSINDLIIQNGVWSRHPEGYMRQTEGGRGSWRIAYVQEREFGDLEANLRVRQYDIDAMIGVLDRHLGLLFRYQRGSAEGFDSSQDHGYVLKIDQPDRDTFRFTLEDIGVSVLHTTTLNCGSIGCAYESWFDIRVRAVGNTITSYLNDEEIFSFEDIRVPKTSYSSGAIGLACHASLESQFDDLEACPL